MGMGSFVRSFERQRPSSYQRSIHRFLRGKSLRLEPLEDRRMLAMTLHVDADALAAGDGLTWGTAFDDLQAALAEAGTRNTDGDGANDVDAIWIAEGTYRPSALLEDGDDRSASFSLVDGVTLYGGFVGDETTLEERDWATYVTTLSGDLGTVDDDSDNAYTVVYCGESVEGGVDGVSIVDGNADYTSGYDRPERYQGGGIFNYGGTLTVSNSAISGNSASFYGGGVSGSGEFEFSDSVLSGNSAARTGGAIYIDTGTLTVTDSSILGNSAESGGGIGEYNAVLIAANCTLSENSADDGAGVYIHFGNLTVTGCTLSENSATSGGGIYSHSGSSLTVSDSSLTDNWGAYGGGICSWGTLTVTSSALTGNSANYGGGIYSGNYALTVTDSTLSGNSANTRGGGIYNRHSTMAVTNSRFLENSAWEGVSWFTVNWNLAGLRLATGERHRVERIAASCCEGLSL